MKPVKPQDLGAAIRDLLDANKETSHGEKRT
jgi:hypothetical protein